MSVVNNSQRLERRCFTGPPGLGNADGVPPGALRAPGPQQHPLGPCARSPLLITFQTLRALWDTTRASYEPKYPLNCP